MKYKAILYDIDGTLLDTLGGLTRSLNAARRMNNLPPQTEEQVKTFINNGVVKMMERSLAADNKAYNEAHILYQAKLRMAELQFLARLIFAYCICLKKGTDA